ncbi:MAG: hypothetical protein HQ556_08490 [Candidatus Marinimicrobia bacterium]|nr:hypothetical protein [Candidatus Neomarinimicrobiota bacterium]
MTTPQPIKFYIDKDKNPLRFVQFNVGEGLMILMVFPDHSTLLYDCNLSDDNKESILAELKKWLPVWVNRETNASTQRIDVFVNSHRDEDHYRGLRHIHKLFPIRSIIDSGQTGASTTSKDYNYYMRLRRTLIENRGQSSVIVPRPSTVPLMQYGAATVYCLNSGTEFSDSKASYNYGQYDHLIEEGLLKEAKVQHTNAIVLSIEYANRRLLLTGDSDYLCWRDKIVARFGLTSMLQSEVLFASHHGSRSFFTDESLNKQIDPAENPDTTYVDALKHINPSVTLISCGEYKSAHHPNKQALTYYKKHTANEQVYTSKRKGHIAGFIDIHGRWTVIPTRFRNRAPIPYKIKLSCKSEYNGQIVERESSDTFRTGESLTFTVTGKGGIFDPIDKVKVWFEVSNGGRLSDGDHQEIYRKPDDGDTPMHKFKREVSYVGRHLLRCRVQNKRKGVTVTQVFIVNGF